MPGGTAQLPPVLPALAQSSAQPPSGTGHRAAACAPCAARPLRRPCDFARFVGEDVELTTTATEGRRRYKGRIESADDAAVTLVLEGDEQVTISFDEVKKCTLKPVYDFKGKKEGK